MAVNQIEHQETIRPGSEARGTRSASACITREGADRLLDALGSTLMHRVVHRRLATGAEVIVANHTVDTGEEHPDAPGAPLGRTGVRWYELRSGAAPIATRRGSSCSSPRRRSCGRAGERRVTRRGRPPARRRPGFTMRDATS